jgi:hypothetical protein
MKTAMQELIEDITIEKKLGYINENAANRILDYINNLYHEKEKKQIIDACWYGHDIKHEYFNPIHYFEQTYNQNK